jgi:hypothetical protein
MERISIEDLDPDVFHSEYWTRQEELVTGVVVEETDGQVTGEWYCRGGRRWGPQRVWFEDGGLWEAYYCIAGCIHGFRRSWRSNGRKLVVEEYQFGLRVRRRMWNKDGSVETDPHRRSYRTRWNSSTSPN